MTRTEFRKTALKVLAMGQVVAALLPGNLVHEAGPRVGKATALLEGLFENDQKFSELCEILGLPEG